jgi:hypothetical protein
MVFFSAMEAYFAETEAKQEPPNNRGLMKFTCEKLKEAGYEHMLKPTTRPKREFKEPDPDLDYVRLWGTVYDIIKREWDLPKLPLISPKTFWLRAWLNTKKRLKSSKP